jgi:hypothetical protein
MLHKQKTLYLIVFSLLSFEYSFPTIILFFPPFKSTKFYNMEVIKHHMTNTRQNEKPSMFWVKVTHMHKTWSLCGLHSHGNSPHAHQDFTLWKSNLNAHQIYISFPFGNNFTTTTTTIVSLLFHNISLLSLNKRISTSKVWKWRMGLMIYPKILEASSGWIIHTFFI